MIRRNTRIGLAVFAAFATLSCSSEERLKLIVAVPSHSVSKLPFVMAMDQDLYAKHGLAVELWLPPPGGGGTKVHGDLWTRFLRATGIGTPEEPDITFDGATPKIVELTQTGGAERLIAIGANDCAVRAHIITRPGIAKIEDLKGQRIGVSAMRATQGFVALLLAQRMGWDPVKDISILVDADELEDLAAGRVDAIIGSEPDYAAAVQQGLPILTDMREWDEPLGGNSINVRPQWLEDPMHREAARRFLMATAEAIAMMHQEPEIALRVMDDWFGIEDQKFAALYLSRGAWTPRKLYPCTGGIAKTMELYDSHEMRKYKASDFYDDTIMRAIDATGFIDGLYKK